MSVFKTIRNVMRPYIRGNVRPDNYDIGAPPPASGSLLLEDGVSFLLLEDGISELLLG